MFKLRKSVPGAVAEGVGSAVLGRGRLGGGLAERVVGPVVQAVRVFGDLEPGGVQQVDVVEQSAIARMPTPGHAVQLAVQGQGLQAGGHVVAHVVLVRGDERIQFGQDAAVGEIVQVARAGPEDVRDLPGGVQGLDL